MPAFYVRNIDQAAAAKIAQRADALGIAVPTLAASILEDFATRPDADRMRIEAAAVNRQAVTLATMPAKTRAATIARMESSRQQTAAALAAAAADAEPSSAGEIDWDELNAAAERASILASVAETEAAEEAAARLADYNLAAAHRLAQLDLLAPRCKWEITEDQADADTATRLARAQWRSIMAIQTQAEIEMGL